mmetsp:Transcript_40854/g.128692  ORF Transcript_40854/g.128692 Transcript_40854/m.128692 type:complete len:217 (+) Transcript_40854:1311-1961(+)
MRRLSMGHILMSLSSAYCGGGMDVPGRLKLWSMLKVGISVRICWVCRRLMRRELNLSGGTCTCSLIPRRHDTAAQLLWCWVTLCEATRIRHGTRSSALVTEIHPLHRMLDPVALHHHRHLAWSLHVRRMARLIHLLLALHLPLLHLHLHLHPHLHLHLLQDHGQGSKAPSPQRCCFLFKRPPLNRMHHQPSLHQLHSWSCISVGSTENGERRCCRV